MQSIGSRQPNFKGALWLGPGEVYPRRCQGADEVKQQQEFIRALLKKIESDGLVPGVAKGMLMEHISRLGMWRLALAGNASGDVLQIGGENWKVEMRVWDHGRGTSSDKHLKLKIWAILGGCDGGGVWIKRLHLFTRFSGHRRSYCHLRTGISMP